MHYQARQVTLLAGVTALCAFALSSCDNAGPSAAMAETSSVQSVEVVDGAQLAVILKQAWQDHPVVVNFWATWCPPCVNEMPLFADAVRTRKFKDAVFLSVSVDHPDTTEDRVRPFVKQHALPFSVYVIRERSPEEISKLLGVDWTGGVPATFLFGKGGKLDKAWYEEITANDLAGAL